MTRWDDALGLTVIAVLAAASAVRHPWQFVTARRAQVAWERQCEAWARAEEARR